MERLELFWIIHLILLALFGLEVILIMSIWLRGRMPGLPATASAWQKLFAGLKYLVYLVFSRRIGLMLKTLVNDGLMHRKILKASPFRWFAHIAVFGSFVFLGLLSTITGVAVEIFPNLLPADHFLNANAISVMLNEVDHPFIAFINDFFGLVILLGMLLIIFRRYIRKDAQLRTMPADGIIIALLTAIVLSGFLLEGFRLLSEQPLQPTAAWGFIGYAIVRVLHPLNAHWATWYNGVFWGHFVICNVLLFYTPFSRFAHIIMSPLIVTLNATKESTA